ncbi:MAG: tRNA nucleotidyltransferase [Mucilaginibacter sp.]|nr:tRNA nucleotidyltransferase [Mucilaginibacter sp.]
MVYLPNNCTTGNLIHYLFLMKATDVVEVIQLLTMHQIEVYVDGGWCVDALVAKQTREHLDLDIATPHCYEKQLRILLRERGFEEVRMNDSRACNFVLKNPDGLLLDVHTYELDENGHNIFGVAYEGTDLTGSGEINGYSVKCICAESTMKFHTGYPLDENDYHDVLVLSQHFSIPIPAEYHRFIKK